VVRLVGSCRRAHTRGKGSLGLSRVGSATAKASPAQGKGRRGGTAALTWRARGREAWRSEEAKQGNVVAVPCSAATSMSAFGRRLGDDVPLLLAALGVAVAPAPSWLGGGTGLAAAALHGLLLLLLPFLSSLDLGSFEMKL